MAFTLILPFEIHSIENLYTLHSQSLITIIIRHNILNLVGNITLYNIPIIGCISLCETHDLSDNATCNIGWHTTTLPADCRRNPKVDFVIHNESINYLC